MLTSNLPHVGLKTQTPVAQPTVTIPTNLEVEVGQYVPPDHLNRWQPAPPEMAVTRHLYEEDVDMLAVDVEEVEIDWDDVSGEAEEMKAHIEADMWLARNSKV